MRVSILGVFVGGVADVMTSFLLDLPFATYLTLQHMSNSGPVAVAAETTYAWIHAHPVIHLTEMLLGFLCSVFGGYAAAAIAGHDERLNGTLSCYLCVGLGLALMPLEFSKDPWWLHALFLCLSPLLAFLGGDLRLRQRMRKLNIAATV
jgi:hypothetical protein